MFLESLEHTSSLAAAQLQVHQEGLSEHPSLPSEAFSKSPSEVFRGFAFLVSDLFEVAAMTRERPPVALVTKLPSKIIFETRELHFLFKHFYIFSTLTQPVLNGSRELGSV